MRVVGSLYKPLSLSWMQQVTTNTNRSQQLASRLMGSSSYTGEMCMESGSGRASSAGRRGGGKKAAEQKANKQPQRGLGVAQLEKIRLHNQMMAAYRSGPHTPHQQDVKVQVPFAAPSVAPAAGGASPFQPYLTHCFEASDRGIIGVHYYENLPPYGSSPPPPLFAHDVRDSSGQRLGHGRQQPQQQHYWVSTSDGSNHGSTEELDLELRL